jgi:tryptophan 2,3-dioxygenase
MRMVNSSQGRSGRTLRPNCFKLKVFAMNSTSSGSHDETLRVGQHRTSQPWMKRALHALRAARDAIRGRLDAVLFPELWKLRTDL